MKVNAELVGEFLEAMDYAGSVNRDVLTAYAPYVAAAGAPGTAQWRAAVALAAQSPNGPPPAVEALQRPSAAPQRGRLDQRVTQLLLEAGQSEPAAPQRVAALRPLAQFAGIPGLPHWRLAVQLLEATGGDVPSAEQVQALVDQEKARERARRQRTIAEARRVAAASAEEAQAYVTQVRRETGAGPTWRELSTHLGWPTTWPKYALDAGVRHLVKTGALRCTKASRSLDVRRRDKASKPPPSEGQHA